METIDINTYIWKKMTINYMKIVNVYKKMFPMYIKNVERAWKK